MFGYNQYLFGKHIDKLAIDKEKRIHTLPVVIGEKAARYTIIAMMILPYILVAGLSKKS